MATRHGENKYKIDKDGWNKCNINIEINNSSLSCCGKKIDGIISGENVL